MFATVSGGHGFVSVDVPEPEVAVPATCTNPGQWMIWTRAELAIPGPECESAAWEVITAKAPAEADDTEVIRTITGVRPFDYPKYSTLAESVPVLTFDTTESGGLSVTGTIPLPDDVTYASDGDVLTGGDGDTVYFMLEPESGLLAEALVRQNQRPIDGAATATFEFVHAPTSPVRVMIQLSVLRAFPTSETTSWVVEIAPDPAGGGWSQRTLLPSGDTP